PRRKRASTFERRGSRTSGIAFVAAQRLAMEDALGPMETTSLSSVVDVVARKRASFAISLGPVRVPYGIVIAGDEESGAAVPGGGSGRPNAERSGNVPFCASSVTAQAGNAPATLSAQAESGFPDDGRSASKSFAS